MSHSQDELDRAVQTMTHRYRNMLRINIALFLAFLVACATSTHKPEAAPIQGEIRAAAFVLVDESGAERGRLECANGGAILSMWSEGSDAKVNLGVTGEGFDEQSTGLHASDFGVDEERAQEAPDPLPARSFLTLRSEDVTGIHAKTTLATAPMGNVWYANRRGKAGREGSATLFNRHEWTGLFLEAEGDGRESYVSMAATPELGSVQVGDDEKFGASMSHGPDYARVQVSQEWQDGPAIELKLDESGPALITRDSAGETTASFP